MAEERVGVLVTVVPTRRIGNELELRVLDEGRVVRVGVRFRLEEPLRITLPRFVVGAVGR